MVPTAAEEAFEASARGLQLMCPGGGERGVCRTYIRVRIKLVVTSFFSEFAVWAGPLPLALPTKATWVMAARVPYGFTV